MLDIKPAAEREDGSAFDSNKARRNKSSAMIVIAAGLVAMALKLYCSYTTIGTNDVRLHYGFGRDIYKNGLDAMYESSAVFNHTPATASFFCLAYALSDKIDPAGSAHPHQFFPFLLRLPMALADFLTLLIILRIHQKTGNPPAWALILFALSPLSFMVSGYHGNVDPAMALLLVAAAYFSATGGSALASGLFFGLSCNVKIIPLIVTPVFFFFWLNRSRKEGWQFALASGLTCLAGWSAALIGEPVLFVKHVLGYSSFWGFWGITYWLSRTHWAPFGTFAFLRLTPVQSITITILKAVIIAGVCVIAWAGRKVKGIGFLGLMGLAWTLFFVFAPGVAVQYMVWISPFLLFYSSLWYAAFTCAASVFVFVFYNTISHGMPWMFGDSTLALVPQWLPWNVLPWAVLVAILTLEAWRVGRDRIVQVAPAA